VTSANTSLKLDNARDYRIVLPSSPLDTGSRGLTITGGRNVVLIGGEVRSSDRGLYLKDQTGTVHIEGLLISGSRLREGINFDQRQGAVVQLVNVRIDLVHGSYESNHADVLQSWAGPRILRVDGLTASSTYQGLFLLPHQFYSGNVTAWDLRNINLTGTAESGYLLWKEAGAVITSSNVYARKTNGATSKMFWPGESPWPGVTVGAPSTDFVPAGVAGVNYVPSP
jgi:hypothetical protein